MFECIKFPEESNKDSATLGYIMFECGLEGISTKMIKRSQFEKSENSENNIKGNDEMDNVHLDTSNAAEKSAGGASLDPSLTTKLTESAAKLTGKKPTTPKPTTPREKIMSGLDGKGKDSKEAGQKGII